MQGDGEELLVTIAPLASAVAADAEYRPWLGLMLMIGLPVLLAIAAFICLLLLV